MYQNNFNANQLPVPCNQVDQSTFNGNLPQGNDRLPQVQLTNWMQANQQIGLLALGLFRMNAQNAYNKSGTHCAAYNLLSQNHFQNQIFNQFGGIVLNFVEFLCVVKGYQPQQACDMAGKRVYEALLGLTYKTYPELQQSTPNNFWAGLQTAYNIYQTVGSDISNYMAGNFNRPQNGFHVGVTPGQVGNTGHLPPINVGHGGHNGGYHVPAVNTGFQTTGTYQPNAPQHTPNQHQSGNSNTVDCAFYDEPAPAKPLQPAEEISSDTLYYGDTFKQEPQQMQNFNQAPQQSSVQFEQTDLPVPMNVEQVVVDPTYYAPQGAKLDLKRPYDHVYNPGGIEIRPAHQVNWEVTLGDDAPWLQLVDPSRFCVFLVKFPDGAIKEKFVEWNPSMEYLRHELDAEMRRKAYRPSGEVVVNEIPLSTVGGDAAKESDVALLVKDGHLKRGAVPPVILEQVFQGATELEVEAQVREELENLLEVKFDRNVPQPNVEYRSAMLHPLPISEECFNQLTLLGKQEELGQVALGLKELLTQGILPVRIYNFINARLTKEVNSVLEDGMCMNVDITDFVEDYTELEDYLTRKKDERYVATLRGAARVVLNKAMFLTVLNDGETDQYGIADNYRNFQSGWTLDDLANLNIRTGKPVLISGSAHPSILEVLRAMITRVAKDEEFVAGTIRLITADGHYLEVIKGRLVKGATLLKLIK